MNRQLARRRRKQDVPPTLKTTTAETDDGTELTILYNPETRDTLVAAESALFIDLGGAV